MKMIILSILVILSGCQSQSTVPKINTQIRKLWSVQFDSCYCQLYELSEITNTTDFVRCEVFYGDYFPDKPIKPNYEYCDDLIGFSQYIWNKKITPWGRDVYRWGVDSCN